MATRNPNNTIDFGTFNFGANYTFLTIDAGATLAGETNPGEALEAIVETVQHFGTVVAIGAEDGAGSFRIAIENFSSDAGNVEAQIRLLGATVGTNSYDCTLATVTDFTF